MPGYREGDELKPVRMCRRRAVRVLRDNGITAQVMFIRPFMSYDAGHIEFVNSNELYNVTEPADVMSSTREMPQGNGDNG